MSDELDTAAVETSGDDSTLPESAEAEVLIEGEETTDSEPKTTEPEKKVVTEPKDKPEEPALIFGKYKDLSEAEAAYLAAEEEKAKYEAELKAFQGKAQTERQRQEEAARRQGYDSPEALEVENDIKNYEFLSYAEALKAGAAGESGQAALEALLRYQTSLNPADLAEAKECFGAPVVEKIAAMTALYRQQKLADFEKKQVSGRIENIRGNLEKFAKETGDWLEDEQRGKILAAAINLSGGTADLAAVKELIDGVEVAAVERYKAQLKAEAENKAQIGKLKSPAGGAEVVNNHENNDDWHLLDAEAMNREVLKFYEEKSKCL